MTRLFPLLTIHVLDVFVSHVSQCFLRLQGLDDDLQTLDVGVAGSQWIILFKIQQKRVTSSTFLS